MRFTTFGASVVIVFSLVKFLRAQNQKILPPPSQKVVILLPYNGCGHATCCVCFAAGRQADLIRGISVFTHVSYIKDLTRGIRASLKQSGTITLEFSHLIRVIKFDRVDTV